MISLFVNSEGGLTTAGYVLSIGVMVVCVLAGLALSDRTEKNRTFSARRLAYCAMAVALAYVTSFIKPFELPYGGSVTLLSMLFIVLVGNWYGVKTGVLVGLAYGVLQFLQEPYFLSLFQVCCDYVLAFAALGLSGLFRKPEERSFDRVHCGGAGPWLLPLSGRVSLLDGLHAGKTFPSPCGRCIPSFTITATSWQRESSRSSSFAFRRCPTLWSASAKVRSGEPGRLSWGWMLEKHGDHHGLPVFCYGSLLAAFAMGTVSAAAALPAEAGTESEYRPDAKQGQNQKLHKGTSFLRQDQENVIDQEGHHPGDDALGLPPHRQPSSRSQAPA